MTQSKESLRNKVDRNAAGFLSSGKESKRSNATCIASFDDEAWRQKDKARCSVYSVTIPRELSVRDAVGDDIPWILEIAEGAISPAWTRLSVSERLCRDDTFSPVAVDALDNRVIGFAVFRQVGDDGELLQIAVDDAFRRCGAGDMLMSAGLKWARDKALTSIFLEVRISNCAAIALYEKHGFEKLRVRKDYYSDPVEDGMVMSKIELK